MKLNSNLTAAVIFCLTIPLGIPVANAQDKVEQELRIYDVRDIVSLASAKSFDGVFIPGVAQSGSLGRGASQGAGVARGFGGGSGGGGFGGGRGGGGGLFSVPPSQAGGIASGNNSAQQGNTRVWVRGGFAAPASTYYHSNPYSAETLDPMIDLIMEVVDPDVWEDAGGTARFRTMRGLLVITCPAKTHAKIEGLLDQLRKAQASTSKLITIKAYWVFVDEQQYRDMVAEDSQYVSHEKLAELLQDSGGRAQIICNDSQTVHVVSGNLKSTVESAIPVVGSHSPDFGTEQQIAAAIGNDRPANTEKPARVMAQFLPPTKTVEPQDGTIGTNQSPVGYQPVSRWVNYGALLQVTPMIKSSDRVAVNLSSVVILPKAELSSISRVGGVTLARHNFQVQQFLNSVTLTSGKPTIVGGSTIQLGESDRQLYLIIEAVINK